MVLNSDESIRDHTMRTYSEALGEIKIIYLGRYSRLPSYIDRFYNYSTLFRPGLAIDLFRPWVVVVGTLEIKNRNLEWE